MQEESEKNIGISMEYMAQAMKDTEINDLNLRDECRNRQNITQRYLEDLYRQKRQLGKLQIFLKKIEGERYKYYKCDYEIKLTSSTDIMRFVQKDDKYQAIMKNINELEKAVEFIEMTVKNMNQLQWQARNIIDNEKNNQ